MGAEERAGSRIMWDVVEEHLDEAEFCFGLVDRALDSPRYTLADVERGPESRLFAHVQGLVAGGPEVAERLLRPALAEDTPARRSAATFALFASGAHDAVGAELEAAEDPAPLIRALIRIPDARVDGWLAERLAAQPAEAMHTALLQVAAGRGRAFEGVERGLNSDEPRLLAAALDAARVGPLRNSLGVVARQLEHPEPGVRDAALRAGLQGELPEAWELCRVLAASSMEVHPLALLLVGALGGPAEHEILLKALRLPTHLHASVRALGLSGNRAVLPSLMPLLERPDPPVAQLAAEAIATIAGPPAALHLDQPPESTDADGLPPLEDDDLDADLVPPSTSELPWPDAPAIAAWRSQATLPDVRSIDGQPATPVAVIQALRTGSTRRNHALALILAIKSCGALRLDTLRLASTQRAQLGGLVAPSRWARSSGRSDA